MCQISAKPQTALSTASTKPAPVFFGMWIGMKPSSGPRVAAVLHVVPGVVVVNDAA